MQEMKRRPFGSVGWQHTVQANQLYSSGAVIHLFYEGLSDFEKNTSAKLIPVSNFFQVATKESMSWLRSKLCDEMLFSLIHMQCY